MKKYLALSLALTLCFSLSACGGTATTAPTASTDTADATASTSAAQESDPADGADGANADISSPMQFVVEPDEAYVPRTFAYSVPQDGSLSQDAVVAGLKSYLELRGDTLIETTPAADSAAQNATLKELATQKVDAVFLSPTDNDALTEGLKALSDAGIPVFGFGDWEKDEPLPDGVVSSYRSDDYNAGYVCGSDLADRCPDGGEVLVVYNGELDSMEERVEGFTEACEESGVPLEIVDEEGIYASTEEELSDLISDALAESPDIVGIFCSSDEDALLVAPIVEDAQLDCLVYGGDGSPALKAQLGHSSIAGAGAQSPVTLVQTMVDCASQYLDGEDIASDNTIEIFLITASNVAQYGTTNWQ